MVAFASETRIVGLTRDEATVTVSGLLTALQYESCPPGTAESVTSIVMKLSNAFDLGITITTDEEGCQWIRHD